MKGRRIGFTRDLGHARVDAEVAEVVAKAVTAFEEMGAHVEEVTPAWGPLGPELVRFFWPATFTARLRHLPEFESRMDPGFVAMIRSAAGLHRAPVHGDAGAALRLYPGDPRVHGELRFPALAGGQCRGLPGGPAVAGALAAARVGLADMGRVLLS